MGFSISPPNCGRVLHFYPGKERMINFDARSKVILADGR